MMKDQFKNYDRWKLMSPDDEADEVVEKQRRENRLMERADEIRDREKDERAEIKTT